MKNRKNNNKSILGFTTTDECAQQAIINVLIKS